MGLNVVGEKGQDGGTLAHFLLKEFFKRSFSLLDFQKRSIKVETPCFSSAGNFVSSFDVMLP